MYTGPRKNGHKFSGVTNRGYNLGSILRLRLLGDLGRSYTGTV